MNKIATNPSTLRAAVIVLLRRSGHTPIEATNKWDNVYSKQIKQARPGTHKFIIGKYTLEFTIPGDPDDESWNVIVTDPEPGFPLAFVAVIVLSALALIGLGIYLIF